MTELDNTGLADSGFSATDGFSPYHQDVELRHYAISDVPYLREVLPVAELLRLKAEQNLKVHLIVPTLNEGTQDNGISNIGITLDNLTILKQIGLVDTIEVYDSGSTDDTEEEVQRRSVPFIDTSAILDEFGLGYHPDAEGQRLSGKGSNIWAAIVTHPFDNDLLFSVDADFGIRASQVHGIISPLIENPNTQVSHPFFIRGTRQGNSNGTQVQGGRVTKLVFQPLVTKHFPELLGLIDPLAGAYGFRASFARNLDLPNAFGVDARFAIAGALAVREGNSQALSQVFTGEKIQTGKATNALTVMSAAIGHVTDRIASRCGQIFFPSAQPDYLLIPHHYIKRDNGATLIDSDIKKVPFHYLPPPAQVLNGRFKAAQVHRN